MRRLPLSRVALHNKSTLEYYYVEPNVDRFKTRHGGLASDLHCQELMAYYRGEEVTSCIVRSARLVLCDGEEPVPLLPDRYLEVTCNDGDRIISTLSIGTLRRRFQFIDDLLQAFPTTTSVTMPFPADIVRVHVLHEDEPGESARSTRRRGNHQLKPHLQFISYLNPRSSLYYLYFDLTTVDMTTILHVEQRLSETDKAVMARTDHRKTILHLPRMDYPLSHWTPLRLLAGHMFAQVLDPCDSYLFTCDELDISTMSRLDMLVERDFYDDDEMLKCGYRYRDVIGRVLYTIQQCLPLINKEKRSILTARLGIKCKALENEHLHLSMPYQIPVSEVHDYLKTNTSNRIILSLLGDDKEKVLEELDWMAQIYRQ